MSDLTFSIANTFSQDARDGALGRNEAKRFYIAPYQRGYKWSSATPNSPVQLLMSDLKDAFAVRQKEYYLQFITVTFTKDNGDNVLEVIDGQQRLTTITLLFSVMNHHLKSEKKPFTDGMLSYEVRENVCDFLEKFIYTNIDEVLGSNWLTLKGKYPQYDEQDIFYLVHAAQKIDEMLPMADLQDFHDYVARQVLLIVNKVEKTITCERIFSNLNTNKVDLTSAELIKGLLLTKSVRENQKDLKVIPYKEILEQRASMGRQWDEIENWANRAEINSFFFNQAKDPINEMLILLALKEDYKLTNNKDKYNLFNYYQSQIKKGGQTARGYFLELKKIKSILNDWFIDPKIYNLLGFLFVSRGSEYTLLSFLDKLEYSKKSFIADLQAKVQGFLVTDVHGLNYGDNYNEIHNLLLSLSVFENKERFDFHSFKENKWSLEHIFPQTPDKFPKELRQPDIILINSIIGTKLKESLFGENIDKTTKEYKLRNRLATKLQLLTCILDEEELILLCNLLTTKRINSIGNMALLTRADNSSNGNSMFDAKRKNIVKRISDGCFVPKHTYDVFSKLLSVQMNPDLTVWSEQDMIAHEEWIQHIMNEKLFKGN